MKHGSLFSGGGGFDLAAEIVGWQNIFHCEKDPFCQTVLKHYWPKASLIPDIKEFDGRRFQGTIDVISGGFPCQPFSAAGKRKGTEDDRYLWPEMLRVITEVQPSWVVGENVLGLLNWNEGMVFDQVQSDLEAAGYEVTSFVLPAAGINAPHQRYRTWIVGFHRRLAAQRTAQDDSYACGTGWICSHPRGEIAERRECRKCQQPDSIHKAKLETAYTNADSYGFQCRDGKDEKYPSCTRQYAQRHSQQVGEFFTKHFNGYESETWRNWPTQPPLCGGDDGVPTELDGITVSKWREQSIKLYGNAIVPQIAVRIFTAINHYELANCN